LLERVFIPKARAGHEKPILLLDGHGGHIVLYLPAHSSHVLQPLDLAPFSVLKSSYREQIRELSWLDDAAPVKKERFISRHYHAREEGLSERVIRAGWRATGLGPFKSTIDLSRLRHQISLLGC